MKLCEPQDDGPSNADCKNLLYRGLKNPLIPSKVQHFPPFPSQKCGRDDPLRTISQNMKHCEPGGGPSNADCKNLLYRGLKNPLIPSKVQHFPPCRSQKCGRDDLLRTISQNTKYCEPQGDGRSNADCKNLLYRGLKNPLILSKVQHFTPFRS